VLITEGKGGHERLVPLSPTFFATVARYMDHERPPETTSDSLFVALKGRRRGQPLSVPGLDQIIRAARERAGLSHGTCHELRHTCFTRLARGGHGHRSHPGPGRTPLHHLDPGLSAPQHRLAGRRVPPGRRSHRGPGARGGGPMNALASHKPQPSADVAAAGRPRSPGPRSPPEAPLMVATMASYLDQLEVSARPSTVARRAGAAVLRPSGHRGRSDLHVGGRHRTAHIEDFKLWLAARPGKTGKPLATITIRHRLGTVRTFFERIMEWDYDDAPARLFIYMSDFPALDEPLPKFLDDPTAAKFMAALAQDPNLRRRLMVELLARTGMRVGELAGLEDDAMVRKGDGHRLRIPVGKLHNDRYVPLLPMLVDLIAEYKAVRGPSRSGHLLERDDGRPFDRRTIHRYVATVAKRAGVGHVHPHQLRHTLATQSINRGMSLEAIAALLGHRSMDMTLTYARISDDTVAEAYFKVTEAVEAQYYGLSGAALLELAAPSAKQPVPTIVGCSPTVTARGPPSSAAPSRASANGAGSSRPVRSSSPS
jgi:site-specific recombinase XerD